MKNILPIILSSCIFSIFLSSCETPNNPVQLLSLDSDKNFVWAGETVKLVCNAKDLDTDNVSYLWKAPAGQFSIDNDTAIWIAPDSVGYYHISCIVTDGNGTSDGDYVKVLVVKGGAIIEGVVKNAVTGIGQDGMEVTLNGLKVVSGSEGSYALYVPDFLNSYTLSAVGDEFCPFSAVINIPSDYSSEKFIYNFSMSPIPAAGEVRLMLTWGSNPSDLDSHLLTPEIDSVSYHISYSNRGDSDSAPFVILDVDDVDGFGPETITIKELQSGSYVYYVHQYSNFGNLRESEGRVEIFNSPNCAGYIINIKDEGDGRYWYVGDINGENGDFVKVNEIVDIEPGS